MNVEDLRSKSIDELKKIILDLRKEQFNARFQKSQSTLENTAQIRITRRNIARAKTILNEKRAAEVAKASKGSKEKAA